MAPYDSYPSIGPTSWASANPKGYANWFLGIANSVKTILLRDFRERMIKASVETEPLPEEIYNKTPLQRAVQLIKRYRDIYYQDKEYPISSIVLTTLMAQYYQGEESIFSTISGVVEGIISDYRTSIVNRSRFKVYNPVNPDEEFTDSWNSAQYDSFYNFITDFYKKWESLKHSFENSGKNYIELFGEGIYKKSLQEQIKNFSNVTSDPNTKASGLIIGNKAFTDERGRINSFRGLRNEDHHNFGE